MLEVPLKRLGWLPLYLKNDPESSHTGLFTSAVLAQLKTNFPKTHGASFEKSGINYSIRNVEKIQHGNLKLKPLYTDSKRKIKSFFKLSKHNLEVSENMQSNTVRPALFSTLQYN